MLTTLATFQVISYRTAANYITAILKDLRYPAISDSPALAGDISDDGYNDNDNGNDDNGNSSGSSDNNKGSNKTKL